MNRETKLMIFLVILSIIRRSVSSPDETLRRELKMRRAAGFFDELRRTLCRMFDITFQTK